MPGSPDQGKGYLRDGEGFGHAKHRGGRCKRGLEDGISRLREGATFLTSELRLVAPSTLPCRAAGRGWVPRVPRPAAPVTSATITQRAVTFHGHETATPDRSHGRDCCATQGLDRASMRSRLYPRARSLLLSPDLSTLARCRVTSAMDETEVRGSAGSTRSSRPLPWRSKHLTVTGSVEKQLPNCALVNPPMRCRRQPAAPPMCSSSEPEREQVSAGSADKRPPRSAGPQADGQPRAGLVSVSAPPPSRAHAQPAPLHARAGCCNAGHRRSQRAHLGGGPQFATRKASRPLPGEVF
jgi:hypothetical protein